MSALIKYDQARQALAACRNVDDIKDIRDKSEAMRLYAKQANDTELEQWAAEIKLRAQRAIGEISAGIAKQSGGFGIVPSGGKHKAEVLADAGISTSTANRYEKLATIPLADVEALIAKHKDAGKPVSAKAVLATLAKPAPAPTTAAAAPAKSPEPPALNEDAPDFSTLAAGAHQVSEFAHAGDYPDNDDTPDFLDLLRAEEAKVAALEAENAALQERIKFLGDSDQAARIEALALERDAMMSLSATRFDDFIKANKKVVDYTKLLDKMRKAAGVEKYSDILSCITPISKEA
ncbi:hypothetical protein CR152_30155 [Massilia violaceinigra]|uniref:Uncharacterized protein n=1 Tax=Massilia violaceinigra TaxID=2045208 RepID=A0A2D2DTJ3_9BURK|nr:hypothetical protein [Massilia violaceinigra]ATQ78300.1 hypothetical protein CR152_30155 [Massilia violaceinigra]